jgi:uncharacterized protein YaaQ
MKLIIAVVHDRDKQRVSAALLASGHSFTVMASTGGFLREGNVTFLVGAAPALVPEVMELLESNCKTREQFVNVIPPDAGSIGGFIPTPVRVTVGGAIAFVLDVEQFYKF